MGDVTAVPSLKPQHAKGGWIIVFIVWLTGFTMPANMAKVTALGPVIMGAFQINEATLGLTIAMFYGLSCIFAFPAAGLVSKIGIKKVGITSLVLAIAGGALGLLSGENLVAFMISRFLEGTGMGFMGVVGVAAIAPWFAPSRRGLPLGIWAAWVSAAMCICPIIYANLSATTGGGWETTWIASLALDIIVLILFVLFYKDPKFIWDNNQQIVPFKEATADTAAEQPAQIKPWGALKSPTLWVLAAIFFFEEGAFIAVQGFLTTYIVSMEIAPLQVAALFASLSALTGVILGPLSGKVSDILGTRKWVIVVGAVFGIIYSIFIFSIHAYFPQDTIVGEIGFAIIAGIPGGLVPAMLWAACTEMVQPQQIPGATAMLAFTQNLGFFIGATVVGSAVAGFGDWSVAAHTILTPCFVIALLLSIFGLRKKYIK